MIGIRNWILDMEKDSFCICIYEYSEYRAAETEKMFRHGGGVKHDRF